LGAMALIVGAAATAPGAATSDSVEQSNAIAPARRLRGAPAAAAARPCDANVRKSCLAWWWLLSRRS
jgi:hypothetical protein